MPLMIFAILMRRRRYGSECSAAEVAEAQEVRAAYARSVKEEARKVQSSRQ